MVAWIVAAVILAVIVVLWRLLRGLWKESHAHVDALPPASDRRSWPVPNAIGQRVMWCPILAKKVILADTQLDNSEMGTVVAFSDDGRQPIISFTNKPDHANVVDKWGAARVLPDRMETRNRTPSPTRRTTPKKKRR